MPLIAPCAFVYLNIFIDLGKVAAYTVTIILLFISGTQDEEKSIF